jgi:hypothetical protein
MKTKILRNAAKLLVAAGYTNGWSLLSDNTIILRWVDHDLDGTIEVCDPFSDTLDSRQQLDALTNVLMNDYEPLFEDAILEVPDQLPGSYDLRAMEILTAKWCLKNIKSSDFPS